MLAASLLPNIIGQEVFGQTLPWFKPLRPFVLRCCWFMGPSISSHPGLVMQLGGRPG